MGMGTLTAVSPLTIAGMLFVQSAWAQTEPQSGYFTPSDGVELHCLEAGSGPTMVFVPGFAFSAEVWEPQLTHFARNHRVVALDPRSQGWSGKPTQGLQLDREEFTRAWVRGMYRSEQTDEYSEGMTEAVLATPTNSAVTLLANLMLMEERDLRPVLNDLDRPVLFAASSQQWDVAEAEMVRERWPGIHVEVLEGTGHALFVDKPDRFNQVLEEFLATVSASPSQAIEVEKELIALEDAWALAVQEGDIDGLDRILAEEYIGTTAAGGTQTKEEYLAGFVSGARKTYSLTTNDLRVRVYGETAVLTHGGHAEGELNGQPTSGDYRWTHVLVKREGRWEAVANHVTRIQEG